MTQDEANDRLLFCPFCRECYEGESVCPVHELDLVEFSDLPKQAHERTVRWDDPVGPLEARFGRGLIAAGMLLLIAGFFAPILEQRVDDETVAWTGFQLATGPAKNFWTVAFVAAMFGYFLYRRRTPIQMMGARLVGMFLSVMPLLSLGYSLVMVQRYVEQAHGGVAVDPGLGVFVIVAGSALLLLGSHRFGRVRGLDPRPAPRRRDRGIDTSSDDQ